MLPGLLLAADSVRRLGVVTTGEAWDTDRANLVFDTQDDMSPIAYAGANPPLNEWQDDHNALSWRIGGTAHLLLDAPIR